MTSSVTQQTASRSHHDTAIDLYPQPLYNARDALHVKAPLANQRTDSADYTPTDSPRGAVMSQTFMAEHARFIDGQHDQDTDTEVPAAVPLRVNPTVDIKNHRYPFCLVWGPLPLITWLFPWIGHLGIGDSEGKVHDFAGPYYIGIDSFMTPIHKYYQFPRDQWLGKEAAWNSAIMKSDAEYRKLMHNICCQSPWTRTTAQRMLQPWARLMLSLVSCSFVLQTVTTTPLARWS
jgi:hypothetical protein